MAWDLDPERLVSLILVSCKINVIAISNGDLTIEVKLSRYLNLINLILYSSANWCSNSVENSIMV